MPFFLMAYRATPHSTKTYSPFYLLHGREIVLPNEGDLKAKISPDIQDVDQVQRLENLKSSLLKAYKAVRLNNRKAIVLSEVVAVVTLLVMVSVVRGTPHPITIWY